MITKQGNLRAEIICHISGSFQNEDPWNCLFSKQEVREYLEQCFAAKDVIAEAYEALSTCKEFIEDAHIVEAQWGWEPIKLSTATLEKLKPLIQ